MRELELELLIGDVFECGEYQLTVIDIEETDVSLKIIPLTKEAEATLPSEGNLKISTENSPNSLRYDLLPR